MATITTTLAASGKTIENLGSGVSFSQQTPVCTVYQVAIELSAGDISSSSFGPRSDTAFTYPPYAAVAPVGGSMTTLFNWTGSSIITACKLTGTPGKAVLFSGADEALVSEVAPGAECFLNTQAGDPGDVGSNCGVLTKYVSTGTNYWGYDAAVCNVYVFYVNMDPYDNGSVLSGFGSQGLVSIGINEPALNSIFGANVIGVHLQWQDGGMENGTGLTLRPVYGTAMPGIKHNASTRPGIQRTETFSTGSHLQSTWGVLACNAGSVISQTVRTPVGVPIMPDVSNPDDPGTRFPRWCLAGVAQTIIVEAIFGGYLLSEIVVRAYYLNVAGKILNPGGTVLSVTTMVGTDLYTGFFIATPTPPAGAVCFWVTQEASVTDPGVEQKTAAVYSDTPLPPHYASEQGAFVPGNFYEATISESDMP